MITGTVMEVRSKPYQWPDTETWAVDVALDVKGVVDYYTVINKTEQEADEVVLGSRIPTTKE